MAICELIGMFIMRFKWRLSLSLPFSALSSGGSCHRRLFGCHWQYFKRYLISTLFHSFIHTYISTLFNQALFAWHNLNRCRAYLLIFHCFVHNIRTQPHTTRTAISHIQFAITCLTALKHCDGMNVYRCVAVVQSLSQPVNQPIFERFWFVLFSLWLENRKLRTLHTESVPSRIYSIYSRHKAC